MKKVNFLMSAIGLGALMAATNAQALNVLVSPVGPTFKVDSTNTTVFNPGGPGTSFPLNVRQTTFFNPITLGASESNLALGNMVTGFIDANTAGFFEEDDTTGNGFDNRGNYVFNAPANFVMRVEQSPGGANFVDLNVFGTITGTTTVNDIDPSAFGSNSLTYTVNSITFNGGGGVFTAGGPFFATAFNNLTPALGYSFSVANSPITVKVRITQSPPVYGASSTAIEGRIIGVPEPGSVALLVSSGFAGSLLVIRRRRRA